MAAGRKFKIEMILGAKDKASARLKKMKLAVLAIGAAAVTGALLAVKAAAVQEKAENALASALSTHGDRVDELLPKFKALAASIQQQTVYGDELVISMMAQIRNMGVMPDQMEKATKGAIGLAKALNLDAEAAAKYTALALQGEVTILQRYIPALRSATSAVEKQRIVTELMNRGYEQAQLETKTFSGMLAQAKNAIGDMAESIGFLLMPTFKFWINYIKNTVIPFLEKLVTKFKDLNPQFKTHKERILDNIRTTRELITAQERMLITMEKIGASDDVLTAKVKANKITLMDLELSLQDMIIKTGEVAIDVNEKRAEAFIKFVGIQQALQLGLTNTFLSAVDNMGKGWEEFITGAKQAAADFARVIKTTIIGSLAKELAAHATTAMASAAKWIFATVPFPFSIGVAGAAVATVASFFHNLQFLADGAKNFKGGLAMVGERGRELVQFPAGTNVFSNPETEKILAGSGGRGMTLVFTGNYIMNDRSMSDFAEMVSIKQMRMLQIEKNI